MVPFQPIAQTFDTALVVNAEGATEETVTAYDGRTIPMSDVLVVNNGVYFDNLRYATIYAQDGDLDNISSAFVGDELKFTYKDSEGEEEVKKVFWTVNGVPVFDTDKFEALKEKYLGMAADSIPNGQLPVVEGEIPDLDAVTATLDDESSTSVDDSLDLNVPEIIGEIFDTFHTDKELTLTMGEEPLNVCSYAAYDVKLFMNDSGEWLNLILPENLTTPGYGELTRYTDGEWFVNGNVVTNTIDEGKFEAAKDEVMSSFGPFAYDFLGRLKFVVDLVEPGSVVSFVLEVLMNHLYETGSAPVIIGTIGGDPVKDIDYPYGNLTNFVPEGQVINFVPEGQVINVVPEVQIIDVSPLLPAGMDMYELFGGVDFDELSVDEKVDLYIDLIKYVLKSIERAYGDNILDAITNHGEPIFDDYCVYADADKGTKTLMFTVHEDAEIQWKNRYTVLGEKKFEGDEVVVNAPEGAESGAWFVNGKRIDTLETVENYVVGENNALTITVCEPVESVEWKEFAGNSMVMSSRKKVGNYIKVNLTAKWALPEGAEVVEAGIARVYAEDCPEDFDAQYIYDNGSKKVSSLKTLNGKYSYALSMNSKSAKKTLCAVSFVTYKIGDVTYTDLSDIAVSAEPAADLA